MVEVSIAACKYFVLMVYCFLFSQWFLDVFASFIFQSTNRTSWIQEQSRVSLWVILVLKWVTSVKFHKKVKNTLLPWMSHSLRIYLSIHWRKMKYWSLINRSSHPHLFKIFHLLLAQFLVNNQFLVRANIQLKKHRQRPWKFTRENQVWGATLLRTPGTSSSDIPYTETVPTIQIWWSLGFKHSYCIKKG